MKLKTVQSEVKSSTISFRGDDRPEFPSTRRPCATHFVPVVESWDFLSRDLIGME